MPDLVFAIDPGSISSGLAAGHLRSGEVFHAGRIVPASGARADARRRMDEIAFGICRAIEAHNPTGEPALVVIEVPSGKVNAARHGGGGAGLAIYGEAVGVIRERVSRISFVEEVIHFDERRWTGGFSKEKRRRVAQSAWPGYSRKGDPGGDVSDAIALFKWFRTMGAKK